MLKISQSESGVRSVTLRLEGRMVGPWVGEMREACGKCSSEGRTIALDMSEVSFADPDGVDLLKKLIASGVTLAACSLFVAAQLKPAMDDHGASQF